MVNFSDLRSNAIMVSTSLIQALHLPQLRSADLETWLRKGLSEFNVSNEGEKNKEYINFLYCLWESCAEPIFQHLGFCPGFTPDELPRIWWIGTGVANSLPFHAAGDHSLASTRNTLSMAVSSYTLTLKALGYARERAMKVASISNHQSQLLISSMPTAPGQVSLPWVQDEVGQIEKTVGDSFSVRTLTRPDVSEMLDCLGDQDMVHFACHGMSDIVDPSESCLILQKRGQADSGPMPDLLTVRQISEVQLRSTRLAFLSAQCGHPGTIFAWR